MTKFSRLITGGILFLAYLLFFLLISSVFTSCEKHDLDKLCIPCSATFLKEKKVRQITHYDSTAKVKETYRYFYQLGLLDSIYSISYGENDKASTDDIASRLKVYYPALSCHPSAYIEKIDQPNGPAKVEKATMTISGDRILNKHIAFYPDENFLSVTNTDDIDYTYNPGGNVTHRNGTDFGVMVYPEIYGNKSSYTYTGNNISKISTYKEQAGYDLNNLFDAANNPFQLQGGVLYYLALRSYPDMEHFETLSLNKNNVTQVKFQGTDISNQLLSITYKFTYTYNGANYPEKVNIVRTRYDGISMTTTVTNLGSYLFQYY